MKCGNCGLVHPPLEQVCRRCEIDMKTGERRARTETYAGAKTRTGGTRLRKVPARDPGGPAAAESAPETRESRRREPRKSAGQAEAPATRKSTKPGLGSFIIQSPAKGEISSLSCLQCEGEIENQKSRASEPLSSKAPTKERYRACRVSSAKGTWK